MMAVVIKSRSNVFIYSTIKATGRSEPWDSKAKNIMGEIFS